MNQTIKEVAITADGRMLRRNITETEVPFPQEVLDSATKNCSFRHRGLFQLNDEALRSRTHPPIVAVGRDRVIVAVALKELRILTGIVAVGDSEEGWVSPKFIQKESSEPRVEFNWAVPSGAMGLWFVVELEKDGDRYHDMNRNYLFATRPLERTCWLLPTGNIYDEGYLCTGGTTLYNPSASELVSKALSRLFNSSWNSDLSSDDAQVQSLFRFRPLQSEAGFEQLPFLGEWTDHCAKASTAKLEEFLKVILL